MAQAPLLAGLLCLAVSSIATASVTLSDTEFGVGPILDVDLFAKATGNFSLGGTFSNIDAATLTLDACNTSTPGCTNSLGAAEFYKFDLGPDSFDIGIGNPSGSEGPIVTAMLPLSGALIADLLDGVVSFSVGAQNIPAGASGAAIDFADITLTVTGDTVPEPATLLLLAGGLAGLAGITWRRHRSK